MKETNYENSVFINCPFDEDYKPLLRAIIFAVYRCGFVPRSALEADNGLQNRLHKIQSIIASCRYGIHDISRTELSDNNLPRFNMPFELGLFFGAQCYGEEIQRSKIALIFDKEQFRYQQFISDLNRVDIKAHQNSPDIVIQKVRNWLFTATHRDTLQGYTKIIKDYQLLLKKMPRILRGLNLDEENLSFNNYCLVVEEQSKSIK